MIYGLFRQKYRVIFEYRSPTKIENNGFIQQYVPVWLITAVTILTSLSDSDVASIGFAQQAMQSARRRPTEPGLQVLVATSL
mgnify:CR=1 FL=1